MVEITILIATIIASAVALWAWQFLNWVWLKPRKIERLFRKQGMKGNPYNFFFGDSRETSRMYEEAFSKPFGMHDDIVQRVMPNINQALQQHGNFCFTWAGPRPRVFIMDPSIARDVLNKPQLYLKPFTANNKLIQLVATGMGKMEGEEWSKARARLNPYYKINRLWSMIRMIQGCCQVTTVKELQELVAKGGGSAVVDVYPLMKKITSEVLARIIVNCEYSDEIKETFRQLGELTNMGNLHGKIWSFPGERYMPTKTNRRANEIDKYVRTVFTTMMNERLKTRKPEDTGSDMDLLDVLMKDLYQGKLSNKEFKRIQEEVLADLRGQFFGGYETTSNLLTWSLVMLSYHQNCQDHARAEVLRVLGNKDEITSSDISKLKYMDMVVNEALRLFPPVIEITRLIGEDVTINGYKIPKDTMITFPMLIFNLSTKYWGEDAEKFNPERFSEGKMKASTEEFTYIPFGSGPRICIGMNLSLIETKVVLAMLLREFSIELSPTYVHAPYVTVTLQPQFGAALVFKKL